ncbi:hypothetical protein BVC80_8985g11 [Macleaya cordata]|uniref:Transmembrane protein n=1 Tax=Macleaya cordata TaxID=56857 RepID=A0A200QJ26_MACCD|nr:hypothetical protein BVC80_8985g11 [Macleaya cordata]
MSTPLEQQQQQQPPPTQPPPPTGVYQQANTTHSGHMLIGPVIAVLAVITILGIISIMIGRLCSGRRVWGIGEYDFEGWVERKCSSCIDGRIGPPPPPPTNNINVSSDSVPVAIPVEIPEESKQTEQPPQNPHAATDS